MEAIGSVGVCYQCRFQKKIEPDIGQSAVMGFAINAVYKKPKKCFQDSNSRRQSSIPSELHNIYGYITYAIFY
jgi:hypothetical protein